MFDRLDWLLCFVSGNTAWIAIASLPSYFQHCRTDSLVSFSRNNFFKKKYLLFCNATLSFYFYFLKCIKNFVFPVKGYTFLLHMALSFTENGW